MKPETRYLANMKRRLKAPDPRGTAGRSLFEPRRVPKSPSLVDGLPSVRLSSDTVRQYLNWLDTRRRPYPKAVTLYPKADGSEQVEIRKMVFDWTRARGVGIEWYEG